MKPKFKHLKRFQNFYVITLVIFGIWMLFGDANSWLIHRELNSDIKALENERLFFQKEIEQDKKAIKELSTDEGIEKLAREKYYMKRDNEDVYIIEYEDSIVNQNR